MFETLLGHSLDQTTQQDIRNALCVTGMLFFENILAAYTNLVVPGIQIQLKKNSRPIELIE